MPKIRVNGKKVMKKEQELYWSEEWSAEESVEWSEYDEYDDDDDELTERLSPSMMHWRPAGMTRFARLIFCVVVAVCVLAIAGSAFVHIRAQSQATRLGFSYAKAIKEADELQEKRKLLIGQLEALRDPAALSKIARYELGMRAPRRSQIILDRSSSHHGSRRVYRKRIKLAQSRRARP